MPHGDQPSGSNRRWHRFDEWDERPLRLDNFSEEAPEQGFSTMASPYDPVPGCVVRDGRVVELDGVAEADFDLIDEFIARYHMDAQVVDEAMGLEPLALARMLVDINVPRENLQRLARGLTPARLAEVVGTMSALEITFAIQKMRQRRQPGNQAHVTNAKDDPLQMAADAATASAFGFDEIETTQRVADNAWSNAMACMVGAAVGRGGVLLQCSSEEAEELQIGLKGFTSYAETVSVYGTEQSFTDGDDTPWSKTLLAAAYASRGIKVRCTSGGASELLMGFHERKSILFLEARCLCLQAGMGVQGTQNGGIDGAALITSLPGGVREILSENLIAMWLGLECATGNDTRTSESEIRTGAKIAPFLLAGTEFLLSGFGSIKKYDNSFDISLFNGEELEDFLVLQRDFEADGGLASVNENAVLSLRQRAVDAIVAVLEELDLAHPAAAMADTIATASGSQETRGYEAGDVMAISSAIKSRAISALDVAKALAKRGFVPEAENALFLLRQRVSGDYLQTSAIFRDGKVVAALNDANHYEGPGTGYRMSDDRWKAVKAIRGITTRENVLAAQVKSGDVVRSQARFERGETARVGTQSNEIVIAVSPAFGEAIFETTGGHSVVDVYLAISRGIISGGGSPRLVRCLHTADTSFLGLTAARLSGSGYGIGLQAKGTAVLHQAQRLPHHNIELFSNAPVTSLEHYRRLGENAARYAQGMHPDPVVVPSHGHALGARYHVPVALLHAVETERVDPDVKPIELHYVALNRGDA